MTLENTLHDALARHRAFWDCVEVDRPLLWTWPHDPTPSAPWPYRLLDGSPAADGIELKPGQINICAVPDASRAQQRHDSPALEAIMRGGQDHDLVDGDFVVSRGAYTFGSFAWMEAVIGCPVFHTVGTCWAEPLPRDWTRVSDTEDWRGSPWLEELLSANRHLIHAARGQVGVALPLLRGPFDVATAALGAAELCLATVDRPEALKEFLGYCTDLYVDVVQRCLADIPPFHGGYFPFAYWGLWAPGPTVRFQSDSSYMISPRTYREQFLPFDRQVAQVFEYSAIATHTTQAQHWAVYAEIPELRVIEVSLDLPPFGRPPLDLLPQFRQVQAMGKALLLTGFVTQAELEGLLVGLSPTGLAIRVQIREGDRDGE